MYLELRGSPVSEKIQNEIANELVHWQKNNWLAPKLVVILVGEDPASRVYVGHKEKMCQKLGFQSVVIRLPEETTQKAILDVIQNLNTDPTVDGILVQLPLPAHIDSRNVIEKIDSAKDVDCLTEKNLGAVLTGRSLVAPCTPSGVIEILKYYKIEIAQKNIAVVGRSLIVGTPLFHLLNKENATITLFHSKTLNLNELIKHFDIVCVAIGKPKYFRVTDFKKGAIVIDVGIHRTENGLVGDVDFSEAQQHLSANTPVPGGVGPTTIVMLMKNTLALAHARRLKNEPHKTP